MVPACKWEMKFCIPRNAIGVDPVAPEMGLENHESQPEPANAVDG